MLRLHDPRCACFGQKNMNFTVREKLAKCRTGILKVGIKEIETPGCSLYTRSGAVPHLTSDVLRTIADLPSAVHLSVQATLVITNQKT